MPREIWEGCFENDILKKVLSHSSLCLGCTGALIGSVAPDMFPISQTYVVALVRNGELQ